MEMGRARRRRTNAGAAVTPLVYLFAGAAFVMLALLIADLCWPTFDRDPQARIPLATVVRRHESQRADLRAVLPAGRVVSYREVWREKQSDLRAGWRRM